jgi:hypothetical protein
MAVEVDTGMNVGCSVVDADKWLRDVMGMGGPQAVGQIIRQAISTCWMMLPEGKKTAEAVEREIRRLVDRALEDLKEDVKAFALNEAQPTAQRGKKR